jgi:hypothetical protein
VIDDALRVHPRWEAWIAENLATGAEPPDVVNALVEEGVSAARARVLVEEVERSPQMTAVRKLARRVRALEAMVRLRREHRALVFGPDHALERTELPAPDEFLARFFVPGIPAIFPDVVPRWPAFGRWSCRDFEARFGDVDVEASVGRRTEPDPDADWERVRQTMPMRALLRLMQAPGCGNDVYVIAKNAILRNPKLQPLLDDIDLPVDLFGPRPDPMRMSLWIGPAGTHTPLHHDGDNAMFFQVVGRKRFRLAPPESLGLLDRSRGVYSRWELAAGPGADDPVETFVEIELRPGDALFLPAGWWHQVDALDLSMSVSVQHFVWPNDYGWYKPGSLLRGTLEP